MHNLVTIKIGISAYNEEANVAYLLKAILRQRLSSATLTEIVVISDGSTDATVQMAKSVQDPRIRIIEHSDRRGKWFRQNELLQSTETDFLAVFDADVLPVGDLVLERMVSEMVANPRIGLTSPEIIAAPPNSYFESILAMSVDFKNEIYRQVRGGNNIYMCVGALRVFSRSLYRNMSWEGHCPEDAWSYLKCLENDLVFKCISAAKVVNRCPTHLKDQLRRSSRFFYGQKNLKDHYSAATLRAEYYTPSDILHRTLQKYFLTYPLRMAVYLGVVSLGRMLGMRKVGDYGQWEMATSTKRIINLK